MRDQDVKSLTSSFKNRRNTVAVKSDRDDDVVSGVLNTVTEDDIKYRDMEITTKSHARTLKIHQQRALGDKLDSYDTNAVLNKTLGGTFTNLDPETEFKKNEHFTIGAVDKALQPKIKVKTEIKTGKKLPSIAHVDSKGFGMTEFYEGLF